MKQCGEIAHTLSLWIEMRSKGNSANWYKRCQIGIGDATA